MEQNLKLWIRCGHFTDNNDIVEHTRNYDIKGSLTNVGLTLYTARVRTLPTWVNAVVGVCVHCVHECMHPQATVALVWGLRPVPTCYGNISLNWTKEIGSPALFKHIQLLCKILYINKYLKNILKIFVNGPSFMKYSYKFWSTYEKKNK